MQADAGRQLFWTLRATITSLFSDFHYQLRELSNYRTNGRDTRAALQFSR